LADQATIAFERIRLLEEAERRARREQLLREITARVRSSADVDMIMKTAVQEVGRALGRETFIHLGTEGKSRSS
jgi:two-component system sensor histidine kinase/response regulator